MSTARIYDINEVKTILQKKYKERINISRPKNAMYTIEGTLDSKPIKISYFNYVDCLLASTTLDYKEVLDELIPVLTKAMNNYEPICSYDRLKKGEKTETAEPTIEWDIKNRKERLTELINGKGFVDYDTLNLKINEPTYGIYPGIIKDPGRINNLGEVELYFAIDHLGGYIWQCNHDMADGRMPEIDLLEEQYALEYLVYQTTKFGVELPKPEKGKHITPTPSYWAWFRFYDNHFKNVLTKEQWDAFLKAQDNNKDTSEFMPSGHWTDLLERKPAKTRVKK